MSLNDFADCWEVNEEGAVEFAEKREAPEGADDASAAPPPDEEDLEEESDDEEEEESGGGLKRVLVEYGREGDTFDFSTQVLERTVGLSLFDGEGTLVSSTVDVVPQRQFSLQEIELLGRVTGWQVAAVHGDLQANVPLDGEEAYRMVVVLKKTAQS